MEDGACITLSVSLNILHMIHWIVKVQYKELEEAWVIVTKSHGRDTT